jgi:hypothetical protein
MILFQMFLGILILFAIGGSALILAARVFDPDSDNPPPVGVGVAFLMLLLTSIAGWVCLSSPGWALLLLLVSASLLAALASPAGKFVCWTLVAAAVLGGALVWSIVGNPSHYTPQAPTPAVLPVATPAPRVDYAPRAELVQMPYDYQNAPGQTPTLAPADLNPPFVPTAAQLQKYNAYLTGGGDVRVIDERVVRSMAWANAKAGTPAPASTPDYTSRTQKAIDNMFPGGVAVQARPDVAKYNARVDDWLRRHSSVTTPASHYSGYAGVYAGLAVLGVLIVITLVIWHLHVKLFPEGSGRRWDWSKPAPKPPGAACQALYWTILALMVFCFFSGNENKGWWLVFALLLVKYLIWKNPEVKAEPEPKATPEPEPPPGAVSVPHWFAGMTEKERKLLNLALDKAAMPGESNNAWVAFGKSLRTRGVGRI